jgi:hypothetical protein
VIAPALIRCSFAHSKNLTALNRCRSQRGTKGSNPDASSAESEERRPKAPRHLLSDGCHLNGDRYLHAGKLGAFEALHRPVILGASGGANTMKNA